MLRTICAPHFVVFSYTLLSGHAPFPSEMLKALEHSKTGENTGAAGTYQVASVSFQL